MVIQGVSLVLSLVEGTLKKLEFTVIHLCLDVIAAYCNYFKFSIAFDLNKGSESVGKVNLRYDSRNSILEWSIVLIDASNRIGSLEFVVPAADPSSFFPISARFSSSKTFSDLKVTNILPLKGGATPKFSQRTQLVTENYQVV
nr:coatomer subunit delta-like [Ipomoea batatas]